MRTKRIVIKGSDKATFVQKVRDLGKDTKVIRVDWESNWGGDRQNFSAIVEVSA